MFDLEKYVKTVSEGIDWDTLQAMDHRIDDFLIVRIRHFERGKVVMVSGLFKDPESRLVWVQWDLTYFLYYGINLTKTIAKSVHVQFDFTHYSVLSSQI